MEKQTKKCIKKAFTLTETLIVLMVIGFLATIMVSTLHSSMPDRDRALFKKAYSIVERVIAEMASDETLYPYDLQRRGFFNTTCVQIPGETTMVGTNCGASNINQRKFCQLFKSKLNVLAEERNATCNPAAMCNGFAMPGANPCVFQTSDGILWYVDDEFKTGVPEVRVFIDTLPNRNDNEIYTLRIGANGKIRLQEGPDGDTERSILRSDTVMGNR